MTLEDFSEVLRYEQHLICLNTCNAQRGRRIECSICNRINAIDAAINAIDKQIPQKPYAEKRVNSMSDEHTVLTCPGCGKVEFGFNTPNFCDNCGQALDFGEYKDKV